MVKLIQMEKNLKEISEKHNLGYGSSSNFKNMCEEIWITSQDRRDEQWIDEICKLDNETLEKIIKVVQFGEMPKTMILARIYNKKGNK